MGWLTGWTYRKSVTLSRASGAVTDYQMKLLVGESSGATGENVDCGSLCLSGFGDIRFTTSDGTTLLDYWIESITGTTPNQLATIWIEFNSIGTGATTFYMYYGKADATSASSITDTFIFGDDFPGSAISEVKWPTNNGESVSSGIMRIDTSAGDSATPTDYIYGATAIPIESVMECYVKPASTASTARFGITASLNTNMAQANIASLGMQFYSNGYLYTDTSSGTNLTQTQRVTYTADYHRVKITWTSGNGIFEYDANSYTHTTNVPTSSATLYPEFRDNLYLDFVFVRKYLAVEPAWGTWGQQSTQEGWLTGWTYRKSVTLARSAGAVTNYQMKLLVGESSGATGENVDCGGLCRSDFADIRFTTSEGTVLLDYWIESVSGTTPNQLATIWIEFDSIGTGDTTFYMYYGKSDATAASNGNNTFSFFDDFLGTDIDTAKWYHWYANGTTTVSDSILSIVGHSSYNAWGCKQQFGVNYAYRGRIKCPTETGTDLNIFGIDERSANGGYSGGISQAGMRYASARYWLTASEGSDTRPSRAAEDVCTDYRIVEIARNSTTSTIYSLDDSVKHTATTYISSDNMGVDLYSNSASVTIYADWILVRKYLATEPAWGTWGAQEGGAADVLGFPNATRVYMGANERNKGYYGADVLWRGKKYV